MKNNFLALLVLGLCAVTLSAQTNFVPGYYITSQSDTIYGEIDDRGDQRNCRLCTFRAGEGMEILSFEPGEIFAYRFQDGGKYYIAREVKIHDEIRTVFLEYLVNGIANLYYYRGEGADRYYIESEDGRFTELSNDLVQFTVDGTTYKRRSNLYVGQMKASFGDCPEIQSRLEGARFSHQSLIKLSSEYHDYVCDGEVCVIYEKPIPVIRVSGGFYLGVSKSSLDFPDYDGTLADFNADAGYKWYHYYQFSTHTGPEFGAHFNFTLPRVNKHLALVVNADYSQHDFKGSAVDESNPGVIIQMEASARVTSLNMATGLQYTFPRGKIRPTIAAGPMISIDMNSYFDIQHTWITASQELIYNFHTTPIRGLNMGGFGQVGMFWAVQERHHLGLNLNYHLAIQRTDYYISRKGISLGINYQFLLN